MKKLIIILSILFFTIPLFAKDTIAVLTFENSSKNKNYEYLVESIADAVITSIARLKRFKIIERKEIKNALKKINFEEKIGISTEQNKKLAKILKADIFIIGSFLAVRGKKTSDKIQINGRIYNAKTGELLAGAKVRGLIDSNIFDRLDEISEKLAKNLDKVVPKEKIITKEKVIIKEKIIVKKEIKNRNFLIGFSVNYALPLSMNEINQMVSPTISGNLFGNYQIFSLYKFTFSGLGKINFISQKQTFNYPINLDLKLIGLLAGIDIGFIIPFYKPLSLHIHSLGGYTMTLLKRELDDKIYTSGNLSILESFEIRHTFSFHLALSLIGSYYQIFYENKNISEIQTGLSIGYKM